MSGDASQDAASRSHRSEYQERIRGPRAMSAICHGRDSHVLLCSLQQVDHFANEENPIRQSLSLGDA